MILLCFLLFEFCLLLLLVVEILGVAALQSSQNVLAKDGDEEDKVLLAVVVKINGKNPCTQQQKPEAIILVPILTAFLRCAK